MPYYVRIDTYERGRVVDCVFFNEENTEIIEFDLYEAADAVADYLNEYVIRDHEFYQATVVSHLNFPNDDDE